MLVLLSSRSAARIYHKRLWLPGVSTFHGNESVSEKKSEQRTGYSNGSLFESLRAEFYHASSEIYFWLLITLIKRTGSGPKVTVPGDFTKGSSTELPIRSNLPLTLKFEMAWV